MTRLIARSVIAVHEAPSPIAPLVRGISIGEVIYTAYPTWAEDSTYSIWIRLMPDGEWLAIKLLGHIHAEIIYG